MAIIGEKIHGHFLRPENRSHLHPEIQAEVGFGIEQSEGAREDDYDENIEHFVAQDDDWKLADGSILETRDSLTQVPISTTSILAEAVKKEVAYQNLLWNEHYEEALSAAKDVLSHLSGDALRGYRALWNYLAANAALMASATNPSMKATAKRYYNDAAVAGSALPWLKHLGKLLDQNQGSVPEPPDIFENIERIENVLDTFGKSNSTKIERYFSEIRSGLSSSESALFEASQVKLGKLLGFISDNSEEQGAPDPWWVSDKLGIVFEDYTATGDNPVISKHKVQQASGHPATLRESYPHVDFIAVICAHSTKLDAAAYPHTNSLYYVQVSAFVDFSEKVMRVIRELWNGYSQAGDSAWRESTARKLYEEELTTEQVVAFFQSRTLDSLKADRAHVSVGS